MLPIVTLKAPIHLSITFGTSKESYNLKIDMASHVSGSDPTGSLRQRLMRDVAELLTKPYPNISLHVQDQDITKACLVLNVEGYKLPMHLTVEFPPKYPLVAPKVRMDSDVQHPNIFDTYICASILNTKEGYTPAYTLKSISIQLLSFFSSDKITQTGGGYAIDLTKYRERQLQVHDDFMCDKCGFNPQSTHNPPVDRSMEWESTPSLDTATPSTGDSENQLQRTVITPGSKWECPLTECGMASEVLLLIMDKLETEELIAFARAWERIGAAIKLFDVFRTRELQCFCLKKDYKNTLLGVGVEVSFASKGAKYGTFSSEFDLLSREGTSKLCLWHYSPDRHGDCSFQVGNLGASLRGVQPSPRSIF